MHEDWCRIPVYSTPPTPTAKMPLDIYGQFQDNFAKVVASGPGWCQGPELGCTMLLRLQGVLSQGPWDIEVCPSSFPPSPSLPY